eukprot:Sdes_comp8840_c0_seq1m228
MIHKLHDFRENISDQMKFHFDNRFEIYSTCKSYFEQHPVLSVGLFTFCLLSSIPLGIFLLFVLMSLVFASTALILFEGTLLVFGFSTLLFVLSGMFLFSVGFSIFSVFIFMVAERCRRILYFYIGKDAQVNSPLYQSQTSASKASTKSASCNPPVTSHEE